LLILNLPPKKVMQAVTFWATLLLSLAQIGLILFPLPAFWYNPLFRFNLDVDNLSAVMLLSIGIVVATALLAGKQLLKEENQKYNFYNLLLVILAGMNGAVMVRDIFSLYVFLEITAIASFILIAFQMEKKAFEGAFKYIIFSSVATVLMLCSIGLLLLLSGDTSFTGIAAALQPSSRSPLVLFAVSVFLAALFIKSGLMPFHGWLPDAYMSAPAAVSVLLAGIATKTVGIYPLIRIVDSVFGYGDPVKNILLFVGIISIVFGAIAALGQNDFKRMLAYSSISQVGYIVVGLGCGTALGLAGAMFHLFNHSIFKSLLFVNSAAVEESAGTTDMDKMGGLGNKMPVTGGTAALASLSIAGIPPLAGFWSKVLIIIALWQANYYTYAVIAVLASLITLAYMLSLQRRVFFGKVTAEMAEVKEAGFGLLLPALILAAITVGVGLAFPLLLNTFLIPIGKIL
jgi:multicomponent Na+:H+ antiporter subunit D